MDTLVTPDADSPDHDMTPSTVRRAAARTILPAALASAALAAAARALLDLDRDFVGLDPVTVGITAGAALAAGAAVLATLRRFSARPGRRFRRIAIVVAAVSLVGPVSVLWSTPPDGAAHSRPETTLVLVLIHVFVAAAALGMGRQVDVP